MSFGVYSKFENLGMSLTGFVQLKGRAPISQATSLLLMVTNYYHLGTRGINSFLFVVTQLWRNHEHTALHVQKFLSRITIMKELRKNKKTTGRKMIITRMTIGTIMTKTWKVKQTTETKQFEIKLIVITSCNALPRFMQRFRSYWPRL